MINDTYPVHFESLYPANSRSTEIGKIIEFIKAGNSAQITGLPGVGRSNTLQLLAYNRSVREHHLGDNQKWFHFVLLNCAEIKGRSLADVLKFIFLSLADSLRDRNLISEHDRLHEIFAQHVTFNDEIILFQGLKEAMDFLTLEKELTIVFMFDRFEEYIPAVTPLFFAHLRILRDRAKYRFSSIFSTPRPLEELVDQTTLSDFYEFISGHVIYLSLFDKPSLDFRISYIEKTRAKSIDKKTLENVYELTGGHGKLTRIAVEQLLEQQFSNLAIEQWLLEQKPIQHALLEIWNFLTPAEQQDADSLNIPLLSLFVKNNALVTETSKEKIAFDPERNSIVKGNIVISENLTASEFKLLKYLLQNPEKVIEREDVITNVWQEAKSTAGVTDQAVDQLIFRLRKKIEDDPNNPAHLQTVKGRGFTFTP